MDSDSQHIVAVPEQVAAESASPKSEPDSKKRVRFRELVIALLLVVLWDWLVYRGGFAGAAAFILSALALLTCGQMHREKAPGVWIVLSMLVLLCCKIVWLGNWAQVTAAMILLSAYCYSRTGQTPYVFEVLESISLILHSGAEALHVHVSAIKNQDAVVSRPKVLTVLMPCMACFVFGLIFVLANPNLQEFLSEQFQSFFEFLRILFRDFSPLEVVGWVAVFWYAMATLRPMVKIARSDARESSGPTESVQSDLYAAARNTLVVLTLLFVVYLVFEFKTLWFREFPKGFHYSGYAHEGAGWLTVALGLSTLCLSLIFRANMQRDPRIRKLKRLAIAWSIENLILAAAVYNRLHIYVDFNGMTRMRIVGLFGMLTVVVGFVLVLYKIDRQRSFMWLVRRQLWAVAFAVFFFLLLPIDMFVVKYNVSQIMAGKAAPAVQISVQEISDDGLPFLLPLLDAPNKRIRDGVIAFLAKRDAQLKFNLSVETDYGWPTTQFARRWADQELEAKRLHWITLDPSSSKVQQRWKAFQQYVYQWY
jgi:hypothetical protein